MLPTVSRSSDVNTHESRVTDESTRFYDRSTRVSGPKPVEGGRPAVPAGFVRSTGQVPEGRGGSPATEFGFLGRDRLRIVQGDIVEPGLGLTPKESAALASANEVWHLAASTSFDEREKAASHQGNVAVLRNVLAVARGLPKLERFVYVSTAYVAGMNLGPVAEDEMPSPNGFRNSYESTKWEAERRFGSRSSRSRSSARASSWGTRGPSIPSASGA